MSLSEHLNYIPVLQYKQEKKIKVKYTLMMPGNNKGHYITSCQFFFTDASLDITLICSHIWTMESNFFHSSVKSVLHQEPLLIIIHNLLTFVDVHALPFPPISLVSKITKSEDMCKKNYSK